MHIPESTVDFSDLIDLSPSKRVETAIYGINPVNTIVNPKIRNEVIKANNSSFESIDVADLLAGPAAPGGKLKNQDIKGIAELFGVDFKKIQNKTANLSQKEVSDAQDRIIEMGPVLIDLASRPNNVRQSKTGDNRISDIYINATMGLNSSLKTAWYKKGKRIGNNTEFLLKPEILDSNGKIREDIFMKQFGLKIDKDGKYIKLKPTKRNGFDPSIKGVIDLFGKDVTNVLFRKYLNKPGIITKVFEQNPELAKDISLPQMLIDFAAGKPEAMQSFELVREGFKIIDKKITDGKITSILGKYIRDGKIDNKWLDAIDTAKWASMPEALKEGMPFIKAISKYDAYYKEKVVTWTSKLKWTPEELAKSKEDHVETFIKGVSKYIPKEFSVLSNTKTGDPGSFPLKYFKFNNESRGLPSESKSELGKQAKQYFDEARGIKELLKDKDFTETNPGVAKAWSDFLKIKENFEPANSEAMGGFNIGKIRQIQQSKKDVLLPDGTILLKGASVRQKLNAIAQVQNPKIVKALAAFDKAINASIEAWVNSQGPVGSISRKKAMEYVYRDKQMTTNFVMSDRANAGFTGIYLIDGVQLAKTKGEHVKGSSEKVEKTFIAIDKGTWLSDYKNIQKGYNQVLGPKVEFDKIDDVLGENSTRGNERFNYNDNLNKNTYDLTTGQRMYETNLKGFVKDVLKEVSSDPAFKAEKIYNQTSTQVIKKMIRDAPKVTPEIVILEQKINNSKEYKKVKDNNIIIGKKAGVKFNEKSDNIDIIETLRRVDEINALKTKDSYESFDLNKEFNEMIEISTESLGKRIDKEKSYSDIRAKTVGSKKRRNQFFIPDSAADFKGLLDVTLGKGKQGDRQREWYKKNLEDPYYVANLNLITDRINLQNDFKGLKEQLKIVPKDLRKEAIDGFSFEQALRVYTWNKQGMDIIGLSKRDLKDLTGIVAKNPELVAFADQLIAINKGDGYPKPTKDWLAGTMSTDLRKGLNTTKRAEYLEQWQSNVDQIYSPKNLNKLEALYGKRYVKALKNILQRMKLGTNRKPTGSDLENNFMDFINGANGVTMFLNSRSAILQTTSAINFIEVSGPNNIIAASKAFANQPQFWKDFKKLMNSDYLVDRRNGLKLNVSESEIADAAANASNKFKGAVNYILSQGYIMTRFADSFAIASGGATYYRNRVKAYMKEGLSKIKAERKAFYDFQITAEKSQQSADPSKISSEQSTMLGRTILAFANYPMQAARIQKAEALDLINGRGGKGAWKGQISRIIYYGIMQNLIFNGLQNALFAASWEDPEIEFGVDDKQKARQYRTINGMMDSILRGSGTKGAIIAMVKNVLLKAKEESGKDRPNYDKAALEILSLTPPIDRKINNILTAGRAFQYDLEDMKTMSLTDINNPAYLAATNIVSASTNVPLDILLRKSINIEGVLNDQMDIKQRIARLGGWPAWQIGPNENTNKKKKKKATSRRRINMADY